MAQAARTKKLDKSDPDYIPSRPRRKLAAVKEVEVEQPKGDPTLTLEAMAGWTEGQKRCRARTRHNWLPFNVYAHATYYDVVERCSHCLNRRSADFVETARGMRQVDKWKPDYRDGYLLPKGAQRIDDDLKDELVASDILSRKQTKVEDD